MAQVSPPHVYPTASCCPEPSSPLILTCLVTDFFPNELVVHWLQPDSTRNPSSFLIGPLPASGSLVASSHLPLPGASQSYRCTVEHPASKVTLTREFSNHACDWAPLRVDVVGPPCDGGRGEAELLCVAGGGASRPTRISWLVNGEEVTGAAAANEEPGRSSLPVGRESWERGDVFTCRVTAAEGGAAVTRNISMCTACFGSAPLPQLFAAPPSYADLLIGSGAASCLLVGWRLEGAALAWRGERAGPPGTPHHHPNGTQSLGLSRPISLRQWAAGGTLTCEARLPCGPGLHRDIALGPAGPLKPPKVSVTRAPGGAGRGGLLLCDVSGFSPRDIHIQWVGGHAQDLHARTEQGPIRGQDVFSVLSVLRLEEGEEGRGYACDVKHPALQNPIMATEDVDDEAPPTATPTPKTQEEPSSHHGFPLSPRSSLEPPSFHELFVRQEANLTCTTSLANATVTWGVGGRPADPAAVTTRAGDASGTRSWLRLSLRDWNGTAGVTCVARGGAQVTRQELSRKTGPLRPPTIRLLPSSPRDVCAGRDFTLFCLVADFYPPEVAAWWRAGASQGPPAEGPRCDHVTQRCSLVVAIDVPAGEWGRGVSYACSVAHISSGKTAEASVDIRADPWDCAGRHFVPCGLTGDGDDLELEEDGGAWTTTSTFVALFLLLVFYSGFVTFLKVK